MALNDILSSSLGAQNMGGLIDHLYVAKATDVDESALNALSVATAGGLDVSAAIPLVALKKFAKIYFTKGEGAKLSYGVVGSRDGKSREVMVDVIHPQLIEANERVIDELVNGPLVLIVRDAQGKLRLCGVNRRADDSLAIDFPMYLETDDANTGAAESERPGHTIQFKGAAPHSPLHYTGAIDLDAVT